MIDRRCAICLVVALSIVSLPPTVRAQQSFQRLIPLLIDLPGWVGPPPAGTAEEMLAFKFSVVPLNFHASASMPRLEQERGRFNETRDARLSRPAAKTMTCGMMCRLLAHYFC